MAINCILKITNYFFTIRCSIKCDEKSAYSDVTQVFIKFIQIGITVKLLSFVKSKIGVSSQLDCFGALVDASNFGDCCTYVTDSGDTL